MKILILNGSPRKNGNTAAFAGAFKEGAESSGHEVTRFDLCAMDIRPCLGCDACRKAEDKNCILKDDMEQIYLHLKEADMIVLASPIHYWNYSAQMQTTIARMHPFPVPPAKKYALILSSGVDGVYDGVRTLYKNMLTYFKAEDCGIFTFFGEDQKSADNIGRIREFASSLKEN